MAMQGASAQETFRSRRLALAACGALARWRWRFGVSTVGLLSVAGVLAPGAWASGLEGVPTFGHVFVIVGENQGVNRLTPARSPYLTGTVKPRSAFLTRYAGATLGGSLANYLAMVAGRFNALRSER